MVMSSLQYCNTIDRESLFQTFNGIIMIAICTIFKMVRLGEEKNFQFYYLEFTIDTLKAAIQTIRRDRKHIIVVV